MDLLDKRVIDGLGEMDGDGLRFRHATENHVKLETYELFISGVLHLIFLDHG